VYFFASNKKTLCISLLTHLVTSTHLVTFQAASLRPQHQASRPQPNCEWRGCVVRPLPQGGDRKKIHSLFSRFFSFVSRMKTNSLFSRFSLLIPLSLASPSRSRYTAPVIMMLQGLFNNQSLDVSPPPILTFCRFCPPPPLLQQLLLLQLPLLPMRLPLTCLLILRPFLLLLLCVWLSFQFPPRHPPPRQVLCSYRAWQAP
jgi:hypothetical protein